MGLAEITGPSPLQSTLLLSGMATSMISAGGNLAFFLSSGFISVLHHWLTDDQMLLWGWRIPFVVTLVPGAAVFSGEDAMAWAVVLGSSGGRGGIGAGFCVLEGRVCEVSGVYLASVEDGIQGCSAKCPHALT